MLLIVGIIFSTVMVFPSSAASGTMSISVSSQSVSVGQNFTVTVKYSGDVKVANAEWCLNYDSNLVSYENKNGKIPSRYDSGSLEESEKSFSQSYTFKALAVGSVNFSISDYFAIPILPEDGDSVPISVSSAAVKIVNKGSGDANLSSLQVSSGTLNPAFSSNVTSYTVNVPNGVSSLSISAKASAGDKAKISLSGSDALNVGENKRTVIVTAEDGTVKKYEIKIIRAQSVVPVTQAPTPTVTPPPSQKPPEENVLEVTVSGAILTISDKPESVTLPDNFEATTYNYKGKDVWAAKSKVSDLLLFYMADAANEKSGFYVYNEGSDGFYRFISVALDNDTYSILQPSVSAIVPSGFFEKTARINGADLTVWVPEIDRYYDVEECRYILVYAMRKDGNTGFYLYDTEETAFMKYTDRLLNLSEMTNVTPVPHVTPVPGVTNPEVVGDETEDLTLWEECKAYFGRLFGSRATAVDWLITVFLILFLVLLMVLAVFIVYVVKKRKEEETDSVPLSVPGEIRNFRKMVSLEEYEQEPEEEVLNSDRASESEPDTEEVEETKDAEEEEAENGEQPLDFTIADLDQSALEFPEEEKTDPENSDETPDGWQLDEKVFDDFFDEDKKE